jgi:hypothetical protein
MITGIVTIVKAIYTAVSLDAKSVSLPNLAANIPVIAAGGVALAITNTIITSFGIGRSIAIAAEITGGAISLRREEHKKQR